MQIPPNLNRFRTAARRRRGQRRAGADWAWMAALGGGDDWGRWRGKGQTSRGLGDSGDHKEREGEEITGDILVIKN